jgi:hypothetical protein
MALAELTRRSVVRRIRFAAIEPARGGTPWSRAELAQGFVGDVGALMKRVRAKEGRREGPPDLEAKGEHAWADGCWSVLGGAEADGFDLERALAARMDGVERTRAVGAASRPERRLFRHQSDGPKCRPAECEAIPAI